VHRPLYAAIQSIGIDYGNVIESIVEKNSRKKERRLITGRILGI